MGAGPARFLTAPYPLPAQSHLRVVVPELGIEARRGQDVEASKLELIELPDGIEEVPVERHAASGDFERREQP